jgi:zinc/manganese transport system substrate-binding protein
MLLRKLVTVATLAAAALAGPRAAHAKVKIVATVPDLAALAKEVGGDNVEVTSLALPTQDPHFVDAKPSLALKLSQADLLLSVGLDLEIGWLPTLVTGARNAKIQPGASGYLDCSTAVGVLETPTEKIDRSQGDIHPGGNPHYLYDPRRAGLVAAAIAGKLEELDPKNADTYRKNYQDFQKRLDAARRDWEKRLAPYKGMAVVTYHKSWSYFVDWLGFDLVDTLEPKPGIPPTSQHIAHVLGSGRKRGVKVILQEEYYPDQTAQLVAGKMPARLVKLPGGADFGGGETYIARMNRTVDLLARSCEAAK